MFQLPGRRGGLDRGISKKPSQYPSVIWHSIRLGQWFSSLIVSIVLCFFVYHLRHENYGIPWTFFILLSVSLLTLLSLFVTAILHFTRSLNTKLNLLTNSVLVILWLLGLALLTWNLTWTLGHRCIIAKWHNEAGIMVCRLYKAVTAFATTGAFSTILALLLDIRVQRSSTQRGKYNQMLDVKHPANGRSDSPFQSSVNLTEQDDAVPEIHVRGPSFDTQRPYKVQRPIEAQKFGYAQPVEQTSYGRRRASEDIADFR